MKFKLQAGAELDLLTPGEFKDGLKTALKSWQSEIGRGTQFKKVLLTGTVTAGGTLELGGDAAGQGAGPEQGFVWSVRRLLVVGLVTAESVTAYVNGTQPLDAVRPLTFAEPYAGFQPNEVVLKSGDKLVVAGSTLTAAATVSVVGSVKEVPEFMMWAL